MEDFLLEIISSSIGLLVSSVWAYVTLTNAKYRLSHKKQHYRAYVKAVDKFFLSRDIHTDDKIKQIDKGIDELRKELVELVKDHRINEEMFNRACQRLNANVHQIRITFIGYVFRDIKELQSTLDNMFSDEKMTQEELERLLLRLEQLKSVKEKTKQKIKDQIWHHCQQNDRIKTTEQVLKDHNLDRDHFLKDHLRKLRLYLPLLMTCAVSVLLVLFIYKANTKNESSAGDLDQRATITFGIVRYKKSIKFDPFVEKIKSDLNRRSENVRINFEVYDLENVDQLIQDVSDKKLDGFILNPGSYVKFLNHTPNLQEKFELFAQHLKNNEDKYSPILIANKSHFLNFLQQEQSNIIEEFKPYSSFENNPLNDSVFEAVSEYLNSQESIAVTKNSSMSGFKLPTSFLEYKFTFHSGQFDKIQNRNHDSVIIKVQSGQFKVGATYREMFTDMTDEELSDIIEIASLPKVPYNSYWIRKSLDKRIINEIKSLFLDMQFHPDEADKVMNITRWEEISFEDYSEKMQGAYEVLMTHKNSRNIQLVYLENFDSTEQDRLENRIKRHLHDEKQDWWKINSRAQKNINYTVKISKDYENRGGLSQFTIRCEASPINFSNRMMFYDRFSLHTPEITNEGAVVIKAPASEILTLAPQAILDLLCPRGTLIKEGEQYLIQFDKKISQNQFKNGHLIVYDQKRILEEYNRNDYHFREPTNSFAITAKELLNHAERGNIGFLLIMDLDKL